MHFFLNISIDTPSGFEQKRPSKLFLKNNLLAIYANSYKQALSLSNSFVEDFQGVLITEGSNFSYEKIGQKGYHLTISASMVPNALEIASSYLDIIATKNEELEEEIILNERFKKFSEVTIEGLVFHEAGIVKDVNSAYADMVGYNIVDIIGKNLLSFADPISHEKIINHLSSGTSDSYEVLAVHKDGYTFPVEIKPRAYQYKGHHFRVASIRNITDRKNAEHKLKLSEERLKMAAEATQSGLYDWQFPTGNLHWDTRMHSLFELDPTSKIDRNEYFSSVLHPDDQKRIGNAFVNSVYPTNTNSTFEDEFKIITPNGKIKFIESNALHFRDTEGNVTRIIGSLVDISSRKITEEALRTSKAMLSLVIDTIPQHILWKDLNSVYLGCNDNFAKLAKLGSPKEIIGKTDYDLPWPKLDSDHYHAWDHKVMTNNKPDFHVLEKALEPNGKISWYDTNRIPICNEQNEVVGILVTIEDITSRIQIEKDLKDNEENLRTTLNSIGDAVISTDIEGNVVRMNPVAEKLTGWKRAKAIGLPLVNVFKIVNSKTKKSIDNPVSKVISMGEIVGLANHTLLISKNSSEYQIADSASPIRNDSGDLIGVVLVFRDVSEEYRILEELRHSEFRFRDMAEMLPVAIIEYSLLAKVTFANKTAFTMFGYQEDDLASGMSGIDLIVPAEKERAKENLTKRLKGIDIGVVEYQGLRKDGSSFPMLFYLNPIITNDKLQGFRGAIVDIRDRKKAEKEITEQSKKILIASVALKKSNSELKVALEKAKKSKELESTLSKLKYAQSHLIESEKLASVGLLSAGIAHEINNPLNFIQGGKIALENFIASSNLENEEKKEVLPFIEMIGTGIHRTSRIVKSLNQFNRKTESNNEDCDINSIIENCLIMLQHQLKHRVEVYKKYANSVNLKGNVGELHQVMLNILTNASQAISKQGTLEITTSSTKARLFIKIIDNGSGISKENIKKITEPFFTTKDPGIGTGLGMSISNNIIKKHNGSISYESEVGIGTTVTLRFKKQ